MLIAGLLMTGSVAAACGQALPQLGTAALNRAGQGTTDTARPQGRPGQGPMGLFAGVALSDDQKAQIKAIMDKYKPAQPPQNDLGKLLTAETVDEAAIRTALQQGGADRAKHEQDGLAMQSEIRAVYTDGQRAQIVAKIQAATEPPADAKAPPADMEAKRAEREAAEATKLGLNDEQKAAVASLRPAAPPAKPDMAAHKAAMVAFWQTGDTSGLQALPKPPQPDVEAIVKAATLLTAEQRKAVFGRFAMGPGRDGGPGGKGHGGHEGPGGRGPGGHGGPRPDGPPDQAQVTV
jgi:Spy/CpxP family protein refolding chaperone